MIHKVRIQNFKCLRDVSVELERFTVFVGANGSGKTSVLEAIDLAVRAATGSPEKVFALERHFDWLYTRGGEGDLSIKCVTQSGEFSVSASPGLLFPSAPELLGKSNDWDISVDPRVGSLFGSGSPPGSLPCLSPSERTAAFEGLLLRT